MVCPVLPERLTCRCQTGRQAWGLQAGLQSCPCSSCMASCRSHASHALFLVPTYGVVDPHHDLHQMGCCVASHAIRAKQCQPTCMPPAWPCSCHSCRHGWSNKPLTQQASDTILCRPYLRIAARVSAQGNAALRCATAGSGWGQEAWEVR